jgi:hypothetical protein
MPDWKSTPPPGGAILALVALLAASAPAAAQTDYYNTDAGRPLTVEDAYPVERRAFELQLAPVRLERARGGLYTWGIEPEMAYGIFPRTHLEVGVPMAHIDAGAGRSTTGIAGIEVGMLHNLNVETAIPALAVAAEALFPAGSLGPARTWTSAKLIATKTFSAARLHLNGQYTFGAEPAATESTGVHSVSRWLAGVSIDRTLPLRSLLLGADVVARQPMHAADALAWTAGAGVRWQYSPRLALDAGIGRDLTGDEQAWSVTFGSAYAFGLPWYPR